MKIIHRYTKKVLYEAKLSTEKELVEKAIEDGANLDGANLDGANLRGANLDGAYLRGAYLRGANLDGAYLDGANLRGAYLRGAYLRGANLDGACLDGANLRGANLRGIKSYYNNHDIFFELIRREKIETIKKSEWEIIGKMTIHRFRWDKIKNLPIKPVLRILKVLVKKGYDEYYKKFKGEI